MRRIDFHIHTVASPLDEEFEFNLDSLLTHVGHNSLDAIAITNHNLFDGENFKEICDAVGDDNIFIFGMSAKEVDDLWKSGYNSTYYYNNSKELRSIVATLKKGFVLFIFTSAFEYKLIA